MAEYSPQETTTFVFLSHYDGIDKYPLYGAKGFTFSIVFGYLLYVLKIGPDFMKNRKPFELRKTLKVYNLIQVFLSAYFAYFGTSIILETGLMPAKSPDKDPNIGEKISYYLYIVMIGKVIDLLDTIFFVLRKKNSQLTFLHIYHHASVVIGHYLMFHYCHSISFVYCLTINSVVHVVMYFYYFASSFGPEYAKYLTWKKHITNFQRVQFVSMFVHQIISTFHTKGEHALIGHIYILYSTALFLILFTNFYKASYKKKITEEKTVDGMLKINNEKIKAQ